MPYAETRQRANALGRAAEERARVYLETAGLSCVTAGWRCRVGELDLVMHDGEILVFVEVRARAEGGLVNPLESVNHRKQQRFIRAAKAWLGQNASENHRPARFDIIAITGEKIAWLKDGFSVEE